MNRISPGRFRSNKPLFHINPDEIPIKRAFRGINENIISFRALWVRVVSTQNGCGDIFILYGIKAFV